MIKFLKKLFQKKYKWECSNCGDTIMCVTQPYCKKCCHVERVDVKMEKIMKDCKCDKCKCKNCGCGK